MPVRARLTPEAVFLLTTGLFGFCLVFLIPPMQAPDEPNHLYRIWQISRGQWVSPDYQATVPRDLARLGTVYKNKHPRNTLPATWRHLARQFVEPVRDQPLVTVPISNTAVYSPIAYLPAVIAFMIGRGTNASALALMYGGRLASLLGYVAVGLAAIRQLPILKWAAVVSLASPMAVFEAATLSADGMAIGTTFLAVAVALRLSAPAARPSLRAAAVLVAAMLVMTLAKSAYVPVALLVFGIPWASSTRRATFVPALILLLCAAAFFGWSAAVRPLGTHMNAGVSPLDQVRFLEHHPLSFPAVLGRTLLSHRTILLESYVGDFGWLDTPLPLPAAVAYIVFLAAVAVSAPDLSRPSPRMRSLAAVACVASVCLIALADYVCFTSPGAPEIEGLQGRYFIPLTLLPLLLLPSGVPIRISPALIGFVLNGYLLATLWTVFIFFYHL